MSHFGICGANSPVSQSIRCWAERFGTTFVRSAPVQGIESFNLKRLQEEKPYEDLGCVSQ